MKGNKKAIALFVFALLFVVATLFLLSFQAALTVGFYFTDFTAEVDGGGLGGAIAGAIGTALGIIFYVLIMAIFGLATVVSGCLILPFDLVLIKKHGVKTWYTKAIWIFAVVAISLAILLFVSVIIYGAAGNAANSASSSASSSSM